jgi:hypothetical protein
MGEITVYHGTCSRFSSAIAAEGLRTVGGVGPFVTSNLRAAQGYALRACCVELDADPAASVVGVVFELSVNQHDLAADPSDEDEYLLTGDPLAVVESSRFDPHPHLRVGDVALYAEMAERARALERRYQWVRLGLEDGEIDPADLPDDDDLARVRGMVER